MNRPCLSFRIDETTTIENLRDDVCKYWTVNKQDYILKTMANSKCQNEIRVKDCFKQGEIAQLRLEFRKHDSEITEAEKKAIQPAKPIRRNRHKKTESTAHAFQAAGPDSHVFLKKMGGTYMLLKRHDQKPSEHATKIKLRDFLVYVAMAILTLYTYNARRVPGYAYWCVKGVEDFFMVSSAYESPPDFSYTNTIPKFSEVKTEDDVWDWLITTLPDVLYTNGTGTLLASVQPLGYFQIRQQRVSSTAATYEYCETKGATLDTIATKMYQQYSYNISDCPPRFVSDRESTANITNVISYWNNVTATTENLTESNMRGKINPGVWHSTEYMESKNKNILPVKGSHNRMYDSSGYVFEYLLDVEHVTQVKQLLKVDLAELRSMQWIDEATRIVIIGVSERRHKMKNRRAGLLYDRSLNGFCDYGIVACVFAIIIWREVTFSNSINSSTVMGQFTDTSVGYRSMQHYAANYGNIFIAEGFLVVFNMFRLISLVRLNSKVYMMWRTLGLAMQEFAYFFLLFLPTFIAFSVIAHKIWGNRTTEYSSISSTLLTVYDMSKGIVDFSVLQQYDSAWSIIFVFAFYVIIVFLIWNVFTCVFIDAFYVIMMTSSQRGEGWGNPFTSSHWQTWYMPSIVQQLRSSFLMGGAGMKTDST
eukprot:NODE_2284_length_2248_cov_5.371523.p1 GENE.NODE_2284_length_2248_cov_5.371523~~NODE_2284_length_2248_cov_5.371523.p1  ORF type:complete len:701 (+),score=166.25 NODE_2284_length_2248_cov_5.371523:162-2105(+)